MGGLSEARISSIFSRLIDKNKSTSPPPPPPHPPKPLYVALTREIGRGLKNYPRNKTHKNTFFSSNLEAVSKSVFGIWRILAVNLREKVGSILLVVN